MGRKKKNKNLPGDSSNCFHSLPNRLAISVFKKKKWKEMGVLVSLCSRKENRFGCDVCGFYCSKMEVSYCCCRTLWSNVDRNTKTDVKTIIWLTGHCFTDIQSQQWLRERHADWHTTFVSSKQHQVT